MTRKINVRIKGEVNDDYGDNDYQVVLAKLRVICAEYSLDLEEGGSYGEDDD